MRTILIALLVAAAAPAEAQSYVRLTQWCFGQSTDEDTIQGCDAVIRWARESPRDTAAAFYNRGIAYRNLGKLDRAIDDYDQALRMRPAFPDALNDRGVAYLQKGDTERAIADFSEAIRLSPDFASAWFNRGGALVRQGRLDRAIADFDRVLELEPGDSETLLARGLARRAAGDVAGGDADIIAAGPGNAGTTASSR